MREIKFRAWHVENQEMIDADSLAFDYYEPLCDQLRDSDEMKFMQFTGLQDKNGVAIYEADCLTMFDGEYFATAKFIRGAFRFIGNGLPFSYYQEHCEVVGNIYENPELL